VNIREKNILNNLVELLSCIVCRERSGELNYIIKQAFEDHNQKKAFN